MNLLAKVNHDQRRLEELDAKARHIVNYRIVNERKTACNDRVALSEKEKNTCLMSAEEGCRQPCIYHWGISTRITVLIPMRVQK